MPVDDPRRPHPERPRGLDAELRALSFIGHPLMDCVSKHSIASGTRRREQRYLIRRLMASVQPVMLGS